jgi:hypothetical protein
MGKTSLSHCASMQLYCGQLNIASRKHRLTGAQETASCTMRSKKNGIMQFPVPPATCLAYLQLETLKSGKCREN